MKLMYEVGCLRTDRETCLRIHSDFGPLTSGFFYQQFTINLVLTPVINNNLNEKMFRYFMNRTCILTAFPAIKIKNLPDWEVLQGETKSLF
jgi:hypothetical protein